MEEYWTTFRIQRDKPHSRRRNLEKNTNDKKINIQRNCLISVIKKFNVRKENMTEGTKYHNCQLEPAGTSTPSCLLG